MDSIPGHFHDPHGIALDSGGNVYVADTANHRVQKLDAEGNVLTTWGGLGTEPGQLDRPVAIAVNDSANMVYVSDSGNQRVQVFTLDGDFLGQWNSRDSLNGLAVADGNRLFVAYTDSSENNLQQLDIDDEFIVVSGGRPFGEHDFEGTGRSRSPSLN